MNTPAHILLGFAAFSRRGDRASTVAGGAGGFLPDMSLYLMAGVSLLVLQIPPQRVFGELYFSDAWQTVFAIDNSIPIWLALLGIALWRRARWGVALCGAALLHVALDFPLHHDDGRAHFWPLSDGVFESPLGYWDGAHHAAVVAPLEGVLCLICAVVIIRRFRSVVSALGVFALLGFEFMTIRNWILFF